MTAIRNALARRHLRRGNVTKALAASRCGDPLILSAAGMHLAVLALGGVRGAPLIEALAKTGRAADALDLLGRGRPRPLPALKRILSFLAGPHPAEVADILQRFRLDDARDILVTCRAATGDTVDVEDAGLPSATLLGVKTALLLGRPETAEDRLRRFYRHHGLEPVEGLIRDAGMNMADPRSTPQGGAGPCPAPISVIMTALNEESRIGTAISSILAQTWSNLELLIVDDGSTDRTHEVAASFADRDPRVRIVRLEQNVGTWRAKNHALNLAQGDFVVMHDADDWSHPRKFEVQARELLADTTAMCVSSYWYRIHQADGLPYARIPTPLMRWNPSSVMFRRREVLSELGKYHPDLLGGDCEFAARIETRWGARSHRRIHKPLSLGAFREGSLTNNPRTGVSGDGWSELRQRHWEAWRWWHANWVSGAGTLFVDDAASSFDRTLPPMPSGHASAESRPPDPHTS